MCDEILAALFADPIGGVILQGFCVVAQVVHEVLVSTVETSCPEVAVNQELDRFTTGSIAGGAGSVLFVLVDGGRDDCRIVVAGELGAGIGLPADGLGVRVAGGGEVLLFENAFQNVPSCGEAAAWKRNGEVPV